MIIGLVFSFCFGESDFEDIFAEEEIHLCWVHVTNLFYYFDNISIIYIFIFICPLYNCDIVRRKETQCLK